MVDKLFYEDELSVRLFEKWMKEENDALEAELKQDSAAKSAE